MQKKIKNMGSGVAERYNEKLTLLLLAGEDNLRCPRCEEPITTTDFDFQGVVVKCPYCPSSFCRYFIFL